MEDRLHTTEVAVKSTRTHEMLRRPPICCECYIRPIILHPTMLLTIKVKRFGEQSFP